ncbi:hypothetical protein C1645_842081 [Glomus cerebriforme]|uniref:Uncharacterized protein n=1 Tax=Glomus cerebriforme TaxID=658196 RepID=A0A397RYY4_9GLOM|nr:hypothetical protein C1645_842081 [Glomus cerebriforme]
MERHILVDCKEIKVEVIEVKEAVRHIIEAHEKSGIKRNTQNTLEKFLDTQILSQEKKKAKIDVALIKLFICYFTKHAFANQILNWLNAITTYSSLLENKIEEKNLIKDSIILLENQESNLADCFFSLAQLGYKGVGIVQSQFVCISTTVAAIWQQMIQIPEISTMLKKNKHSKQKSSEIRMSQLR